MTYRIKIRRRFLPIWRSFYVVSHATEVLGDSARLVLSFADGTKRAIPGIHKREAIVYPMPVE
jgi:hypothetical protein